MPSKCGGHIDYWKTEKLVHRGSYLSANPATRCIGKNHGRIGFNSEKVGKLNRAIGEENVPKISNNHLGAFGDSDCTGSNFFS